MPTPTNQPPSVLPRLIIKIPRRQQASNNSGTDCVGPGRARPQLSKRHSLDLLCTGSLPSQFLPFPLPLLLPLVVASSWPFCLPVALDVVRLWLPMIGELGGDEVLMEERK